MKTLRMVRPSEYKKIMKQREEEERKRKEEAEAAAAAAQSKKAAKPPAKGAKKDEAAAEEEMPASAGGSGCTAPHRFRCTGDPSAEAGTSVTTRAPRSLAPARRICK